MIRASVTKFPNSVQLFKFCQKVLMDQRGVKIHDQEVGSVLNFNPSDCSHWKRGEKNVKSVFALAKLADMLGVEVSLVHDVATGSVGLEEAYYEYSESKLYRESVAKALNIGKERLDTARMAIDTFVRDLHQKADFRTPPLYVPEVLRFFPFINTQPTEMLDRLSRVLRVRPGQYMIQFKKGELKPQTRMSMTKDLARIVFEAERSRYPEFGAGIPELVSYEQLLFTSNLLAPKQLLLEEMSKMDFRQNVVAELATIFWVPKSLVGFQMQEIFRSGYKAPTVETQQSVVETQGASS